MTSPGSTSWAPPNTLPFALDRHLMAQRAARPPFMASKCGTYGPALPRSRASAQRVGGGLGFGHSAARAAPSRTWPWLCMGPPAGIKAICGLPSACMAKAGMMVGGEAADLAHLVSMARHQVETMTAVCRLMPVPGTTTPDQNP